MNFENLSCFEVDEDKYYWPLNDLEEEQDYISVFNEDWLKQDTEYLGLELIKCWDVDLIKKIAKRYPTLKGLWIWCDYISPRCIDINNLPRTIEIMIFNNCQNHIAYPDLFDFPALKLLISRKLSLSIRINDDMEHFKVLKQGKDGWDPRSKSKQWPPSLEYMVLNTNTTGGVSYAGKDGKYRVIKSDPLPFKETTLTNQLFYYFLRVVKFRDIHIYVKNDNFLNDNVD